MPTIESCYESPGASSSLGAGVTLCHNDDEYTVSTFLATTERVIENIEVRLIPM